MLKSLNDSLAIARPLLESSGVSVEGFSSGSAEGDYWSWTFSTWWPFAYEFAGVTIAGRWLEGYDKNPSETITLDCLAQVFSRGSLPRLSDRWSRELSLKQLAETSLQSVVESEIAVGLDRLSCLCGQLFDPELRVKPFDV